jgi:hypothetical protein
MLNCTKITPSSKFAQTADTDTGVLMGGQRRMDTANLGRR